MTVEAYRDDRIAELGEFIGTVIAGIYEGIRNGEADNPSLYAEAAGREHVTWSAYFSRVRRVRRAAEPLERDGEPTHGSETVPHPCLTQRTQRSTWDIVGPAPMAQTTRSTHVSLGHQQPAKLTNFLFPS